MAWARPPQSGCALLLLGLTGCALPGARPAAALRDRALAEQFNERGLTLIEHGDPSGAQALFRKALDADPFCGPAHCNLGVALLQLGRFHEAGWEFRSAIQLMPKAAPPRANLGLLFERVGRYGPAEENLRAALQLAPDDIEIIGHLARVHVRQGKRDAETLDWLAAVATQDDDPAWRSWAGKQLAFQARTPVSEAEP